MREIQKVSAVLGYFRCMIGNNADVWIYCSSRPDGCMLRVCFICSPFVSSERDAKTAAPLEICTKDEQCSIVRSCDLKE